MDEVTKSILEGLLEENIDVSGRMRNIAERLEGAGYKHIGRVKDPAWLRNIGTYDCYQGQNGVLALRNMHERLELVHAETQQALTNEIRARANEFNLYAYTALGCLFVGANLSLLNFFARLTSRATNLTPSSWESITIDIVASGIMSIGATLIGCKAGSFLSKRYSNKRTHYQLLTDVEAIKSL